MRRPMEFSNLVLSICLILSLTSELCSTSATERATHERPRDQRSSRGTTKDCADSKWRPNSAGGPSGDHHYPSQSASPRIINGRPAKPGEFPFVVRIVEGGKTECTGSIVDVNHVLTAAHCLIASPGALSIFAGEASIRQPIGRAIYGVEKYFRHEKFDRRTGSNDIAIIRTSELIKFSDGDRFGRGRVKTVDLASDSSYVNSTAVALGWGYKDLSLTPTDQLMAFQTRLIACSNPRGPGLICTARRPPGSICYGDSGGPLMAKSARSGQLEQVGLVSRAAFGGCTPQEVIHTDVNYHSKWIEDKIASP